MKPTALALTLLFIACTTLTASPTPTAAVSFPGRQFEHVLIIVLENEDHKEVMKNHDMIELAAKGRLFTNFNGLFHPSYANYLAMVGGKFFDTKLDQQKDIDSRTIADLLEAHQLTWTQYAENYPGNCFRGDESSDPGKLYRRKHVPFMSFKSIQTNPDRCNHVVDAPSGSFDAHHLPNYAFYTPNMRNDGHDTSLDFAAKWLKGFLAPILSDQSVMKDTLIVVTFDESAAKFGKNNHIYTVFLGDMVEKGADATRYDHYNVLRTIEENFGIGNLGAQDQKAAPISDAWKLAP